MKFKLITFKTLFIYMILTSISFTACKKKVEMNEKPIKKSVIEKPELKIENGRFTPEIMWGLGKMGEYSISPDNRKIAYTLTYYSIEKNKGNSEIYLMNIDGSNLSRLTITEENENNVLWMDNDNLVFLRDKKIIQLNIKDRKENSLCEFSQDVEAFSLSPDRSKILYISCLSVQKSEDISKLYKGLDKASGRINEDLMYRHWDSWVDEYPHIFIANFNKENKQFDIDKAVDVLEGEVFECPMRPWGGLEQTSWSPDSKKIAYTCRKKTGKEYALSTNSDIFLYDIESKQTSNLSEGMMGYDQNPVFSNDGKKIAWESMEHEGYESDKTRLMVYDFENETYKDYTENFDYGVGNIAWTKDNSEIYAIVMYRGTQEIFAFNLNNNNIRRVTKGIHDINGFSIADDKIITQQVSMSYPSELYAYNTMGEENEGNCISNINTEVLNQIKMGKLEEKWIKTTDGKQMLVWIIYPYNYDSTKTYPALLFCEGGPQSMVSQFWSTRWNFQVMSGAGYFVIAPNRRGCPGFGSEWCEQISGDYGGQNMKDYLQSVDVILKENKNIDPERLGACGASYGGFSIYWLAGHHNKRFKAFLAHDGMFNLEQQYCETEEMWFVNWDLGGPYWDKSNAKAQKSYNQSPHKFVDKWDTPICVVHSEKDYRIVASQGMSAYNAAVLRGIPARYLYFPDENHWVLQPQNSLLWHRNFIDWFDKWLK